MRWLFRKRVERFEPPPRVEPKPPEEPTAAEEAVQAATFQADSIRETINLLESDLGAMIGDVQRACVFVCDRAEDSAAASDKIVQRSDTLVVRAGSASRDLTQLAASIEELARASDDIGRSAGPTISPAKPMNPPSLPAAALKASKSHRRKSAKCSI
jgi:hypothetical protein